MEKLNMQTTNIVDENIKKIGEMFPNCLTERLNDEGKPEIAIDFDQLRQELSKDIVEGPEERYQFTWPDKRNAIRLANAPTTDTLRPCREESVDFNNTQNLYIEGDNLEVLKLLRENYLGKVKMIYIDPPYNTGNDFVYNDEFSQEKQDFIHNSEMRDNDGNWMIQNNEKNTETNGRFHTDWLNMMYPRLKVAKDLLSEDGVIFISIDDNEVENLRKICDEIFGSDNFVANYIWEKKKKPSFLNANIGTKTEYIVCYSKDRTMLGALSVDTTEEGKKYPFNNAGNSIANLTFPKGSVKFNMKDCVVEPQDMSEGNIITSLENELHIVNGTNENNFTLRGEWRYSQAKLDEIVANKEGIVISKIPFRPNHIKQGGEIKKMHNLLSIDNYKVGTNEDATAEQTKLLGKNYFDYAKPSTLIQLLVKASTYSETDAIIMDFFSGSGTTAQSVFMLNAEDNGNRKSILVQLPEKTDEESEARKDGYDNICEIGKERIRRAGKKIKTEHPEAKDLDTGFRVLKLDSSNMQDVYYTPADFNERDLFEENIKPDRTEEDLLFQAMIELGIELSAKIEKTEIAGKTVWNVSDGYLMACFDENVNETTITEIAKQQPYYFVMCDKSLANDNVADNFEQIFEHYSKDTIRRIL